MVEGGNDPDTRKILGESSDRLYGLILKTAGSNFFYSRLQPCSIARLCRTAKSWTMALRTQGKRIPAVGW